MTLFEKYGGIQTVKSVVKAFYIQVLKNEALKFHFHGIDTERLINHQVIFIAHMLGKPAEINVEKTLRDSHKGRKISENDFNKIIHILHDVLFEHSVEEDDIAAILNLMRSHSSDIVDIYSRPPLNT